MKALLVVTHASRESYSNQEFKTLADKIRALLADQFNLIDCALLPPMAAS